MKSFKIIYRDAATGDMKSLTVDESRFMDIKSDYKAARNASELIELPGVGEVQRTDIKKFEAAGEAQEMSDTFVTISNTAPDEVFGAQYEVRQTRDRKTQKVLKTETIKTQEEMTTKQKIDWYNSEVHRLVEREKITGIPDGRVGKYIQEIQNLKTLQTP